MGCPEQVSQQARPHWAGGPPALSVPARSHSARTHWVQNPRPSPALRLPSSENEYGIVGREREAVQRMKCQPLLISWVTSNLHTEEILLRGNCTSALQVGTGCRGQRDFCPPGLDDTLYVFCWGLQPSTCTCFLGRMGEMRTGWQRPSAVCWVSLLGVPKRDGFGTGDKRAKFPG